MDEFEILELFMLRTVLTARIQELTLLLEKRETNLQANEMLDIYLPILGKVDSAIAKRNARLGSLLRTEIFTK